MGSILSFSKKAMKLQKFSKYVLDFFFDNFSEVDGFENLYKKLNGFHGTHRTHANEVPGLIMRKGPLDFNLWSFHLFQCRFNSMSNIQNRKKVKTHPVQAV